MASQRRADLLLVSITVVWGSTFVVTKDLLDSISPLFYSGIRFLIAALILLALFFMRCLKTSMTTARHGFVLGLLLFVGFVLQTVGITYTTASKAAFFTGMLVPLTPIIHYVAQSFFEVRKRPLTIGNIAGVACAGLGLYLLTLPTGSGFNLGDALNLGAAFFFACFIVYLDQVPEEVDKLQMTFIQFLTCGVIGLGCALPFEEVKVVYSTDLLLGFSYLTIFATVITMWVQNRFQGDTTPTRAAVIFGLEPVVAAVCAYIFRNEILGMVGIMGAVIIFVGLLLSELSDDLPFLSRTIR